jgi:succinate dehydrogenase / fumarate reductase iron-sulfur subunit
MQSCSALVDNLTAPTREIELEPMSRYPVIRDLMVDRRGFLRASKGQGRIPCDGYYDAGPGPVQSFEQSELRYPLSKCMTCGCCMEACPQYAKVEVHREYGESEQEHFARRRDIENHAFMGAAVISQAILFNEHPTGAMSKGERLEALMEPGGITDCGNSQNCVKVCPKLIPLTWSIGKAGRDTTVHSINRFFLRQQ